MLLSVSMTSAFSDSTNEWDHLSQTQWNAIWPYKMDSDVCSIMYAPQGWHAIHYSHLAWYPCHIGHVLILPKYLSSVKPMSPPSIIVTWTKYWFHIVGVRYMDCEVKGCQDCLVKKILHVYRDVTGAETERRMSRAAASGGQSLCSSPCHQPQCPVSHDCATPHCESQNLSPARWH